MIFSYSILSIKYYQWALVAISVLIYSILKVMSTRKYIEYFKVLAFSIFLPVLLFALTAPSIAMNIGFKVNLEAISSRSGDSISILNSNEIASITDTSGNQITLPSNSTSVQVLRPENSNSNLTRSLQKLGLLKYIQEDLTETINNNFAQPKKIHILEPAQLNNPLRLILASLKYYFGPILSFDINLFQALILFETPIWWLLAFLIILKLFSAIKRMEFDLICRNVPSLLFVLMHTVAAGLVEVNVGTAARHKSVLMFPLLLILISLNSIRLNSKK
jgi:hypothetical protein